MYNEILILGIIVSILFYEITGLTPAGIVVAGYIVLSLQNPLRIVYTLLLALAAVGVLRLADRFIILYGKRRFAAGLTVCYLLAGALTLLAPSAFFVSPIGTLVPGIIANACDRQGVVKSLVSLAVVVTVVTLIALLLGSPVL